MLIQSLERLVRQDRQVELITAAAALACRAVPGESRAHQALQRSGVQGTTDTQSDEHVDRLTIQQVRQRQSAGGGGLQDGQHLGDLHAFSAVRFEAETHPASGGQDQALKFPFEDGRQQACVLDVQVVAVARLGDRHHQRLVVMAAEPHRGGADAGLCQSRHKGAHLPGVLDAVGGLAVAQQDDAVQGAGVEVSGDLSGAAAPAAFEEGSSACPDVLRHPDQALWVGNERRRDVNPGVVSEADHADAVFRVKLADGGDGRLPGLLDRLAVHAAAAVEHQR